MTKYDVCRDKFDVEVNVDRQYSPDDVSPTYWALVSKALPGKYVFAEDKTNYDSVIGAAHLAVELCRHDFKLPFKKTTWYRWPRLYIDRVGKLVLMFLNVHLERLRDISSHHRLTPTIEALVDVANNFNSNFEPSSLKYIDNSEIDAAVTEFNDLALKMRNALLATGMRERVKSFRRNCTRNYRHLMTVMRAAHERHSKILLIRLDWTEKDVDFSGPIERLSQAEFDAGALRMAGIRDKMLRHLKQHFKSDLSFYAWKFEWGFQGGFHIHWVIGLNGSKYQDRIGVPLLIAEHWNEVLLKGQGHTQNVNGMPGKDQAGLTVWHYSDSKVGKAFGLFADYLTKIDYTLKLRLPKGMRSFGCSKLVRRTGCKTGPGRIHPMSAYDIDTVRGQRGRVKGRLTLNSLTKELQ